MRINGIDGWITMTFVHYMGYFLLDLRQLAAFAAILCMRKEIQFFTRVLLAFLIEVSRTRLSARMWSILAWPVWADGGCCERDSIRSLLLYTLFSVFFCILYWVWYCDCAQIYMACYLFRFGAAFPAMGMAILLCRFSRKRLPRARRTNAESCLCRERNAALSPSSSYILPTHSHSCGGARAQSKYVVTLFLVWVPCAIKGMPEMSTTLALIAFSICPSCIASFSSRSVIVCVCTSVLNVTPDHTRQKCRLYWCDSSRAAHVPPAPSLEQSLGTSQRLAPQAANQHTDAHTRLLVRSETLLDVDRVIGS